MIVGYQHICEIAVKEFDGNIAQYLGDGVLVYFGYPQAHEEDARRAIETAIAMGYAVDYIDQELNTYGELVHKEMGQYPDNFTFRHIQEKMKVKKKTFEYANHQINMIIGIFEKS